MRFSRTPSSFPRVPAWVTVPAILVAAGAILAMRPHAPPAGEITGKVTFTGTPPKMRPIDMAKEPSCAKEHPTPVMTETVVTGPGNALGNVVVYISSGDPGGAAPTQVVTYEQKGCEYLPHVAAMTAGQPMRIVNEDATSHNIHPMAKVNSEWNKSQPKGAPPIQTSWAKPEFIPVKCNVHPWMHGWFAVLPTSHYAVSGKDGSFSLAGLPPGKYTVTAWHERFGTQRQDVTVGANGSTPVNFVFQAKPY